MPGEPGRGTTIGGGTPTFQWPSESTTPPEESFVPKYKYFTPEELAASGIDLNTWFGQYANQFNPQNVADMNYAQTYAGTPVATGYLDESGKFIGNPFAAAAPLTQLRNLQFPDLTLNDEAQNQAMSGMSELIQQMKNFQPMTAEQRRAYGEEMGGYNPGSVETWNQQLGGGIAGMQGMSAQEKSLYQRNVMNQIDSMRKENREIIGALAGAGRSIAAFSAMEAATSQIADYNIQLQLTMIENDFAKKQIEYTALKEQRDQVLGMGLEGSQQYEQALISSWNNMVTSYSTQITALAQQDQQDIDAFSAHADAFYKQIMTEIGVTDAAMEQSYQLFAQGHMDELLEQIDEVIKNLMD